MKDKKQQRKKTKTKQTNNDTVSLKKKFQRCFDQWKTHWNIKCQGDYFEKKNVLISRKKKVS